jgi:hypothetical protein
MNLIAFFKKNFLILFIIIIAGNIYYFKSQNVERNFYRGICKFRTKSLVYDRMNTLLEQIINQFNSSDSKSKFLFRSYRNEDNYIFEFSAESPDSLVVLKVFPEVIQKVKSDSLIRLHYFDKLDRISKAIDSQREFLKITETLEKEKMSPELKYDAEFKKRSTEINILNLTTNYANIIREFEIIPFNTADVVYIHNSFIRELIKINFVLVVIGIFVIVIYRQFKN